MAKQNNDEVEAAQQSQDRPDGFHLSASIAGAGDLHGGTYRPVEFGLSIRVSIVGIRAMGLIQSN